MRGCPFSLVYIIRQDLDSGQPEKTSFANRWAKKTMRNEECEMMNTEWRKGYPPQGEKEDQVNKETELPLNGSLVGLMGK